MTDDFLPAFGFLPGFGSAELREDFAMLSPPVFHRMRPFGG
jgi:hypothetical protein